MPHIHHHRKALLIVLLLCVTGITQYAALVSEPETHHASDHCCLLCHAGPLQFLQVTASSGMTPVFAVVWLTPTSEVPAVQDVQLRASSARAPPAV
jgi:hypothetical protein